VYSPVNINTAAYSPVALYAVSIVVYPNVRSRGEKSFKISLAMPASRLIDPDLILAESSGG